MFDKLTFKYLLFEESFMEGRLVAGLYVVDMKYLWYWRRNDRSDSSLMCLATDCQLPETNHLVSNIAFQFVNTRILIFTQSITRMCLLWRTQNYILGFLHFFLHQYKRKRENFKYISFVFNIYEIIYGL